MHQRFEPWVAEHKARYEGLIDDLGYNPAKYHSQSLDTYKTPAVLLRRNDGLNKSDAEKATLDELKRLFSFSLESESKAEEFINEFYERPAFEGSHLSYAELVVQSIEQGKKVGLVCDHAEDLGDIVKASAALGLAISKNHGTRYTPAFNIWINKLMTRETYMGIPVEDLAGLAGNIRWAMPDTGTALKYGFGPNDSLTKQINYGTLRGYKEDLGVGTIESLVPAGSGMEEIRTSTGELESLSQKPTSEATAQLLGRMDVLIPVSVWKNKWQIGDARELDDIKELPKAERRAPVSQLVSAITASLAQSTANLSGVPVRRLI